MPKNIGFAVGVGYMFVAGLCQAASSDATQDSRVPSNAEKDVFVRQVMRGGGIPGLQAVVVDKHGVIWHRSYGYAVLSQPGPAVPMKDDSIFYICSVGKMITAIAVMQQVEKGRIALDDDINASLPFSVRNPNWPSVPITWRMLLTHTSSIKVDDSVEASYYFYGVDSSVTLEQYVENVLKPGGVNYRVESFRAGRPGTERAYSDVGFDLLGYAVARIVHETFDSYVSHAIFGPLHMTESSYFLRDLPAGKMAVGYGRTENAGHWIFAPNRVAFGHLPAGRTAFEEQMTAPDPPSGILHTSALQFAKLVRMFLNLGTLDGAKVLDPESVKLLATFSGIWSIYGYQQGLSIYALRDLDDHLVWGHDGQDRGYCSAVFFDFDAGIGAVAFANANRDDELLSRRLVDLDVHMLDWFK